MKIRWVRAVARLMWVFPLILLFLTLNQAFVAVDLKHTLEKGTEAIADITEIRVNDRVDIPFGYVSLRVQLDDGSEIVQEKMALPYTLLPYVRNKDRLDVMVQPGAKQQIVIRDIAATQWKMAGMQAMISFVGMVLAAAGVFFWNRLLKRGGDPAENIKNVKAAQGM